MTRECSLCFWLNVLIIFCVRGKSEDLGQNSASRRQTWLGHHDDCSGVTQVGRCVLASPAAPHFTGTVASGDQSGAAIVAAGGEVVCSSACD